MSTAVFPPEFHVVRRADGRIRIHDPVSDLSWNLGRTEYAVATLIDGRRSVEEIAAELVLRENVHVRLERITAFIERLRILGMLVDREERQRRRDGFAGLSYGPWKTRLLVSLLDIDPTQLLAGISRSAPWLLTRAAVLTGIAIIVAALALILSHWAAVGTTAAGLARAPWVVIAYYPIAIASILLHELGHALACHRYGVRTRRLGAGVYVPFVTGWSRPEQESWEALPRNARVVTIVMGPLVSFFVAGIGAIAWVIADALGASGFASFGLLVAIISAAGTIPTLLPIFNGDGYLLVTELCDAPGLRQRSWRYVGALVRGERRRTATVSRRDALLALAVVGGTIASWGLAWGYVIRLAVGHQRFQGGKQSG